MVMDRQAEYPLLSLLTRRPTAPRRTFVIPQNRMADFIDELTRILAEAEKLDEPWARDERSGSYTELRQVIWHLRGIAENCKKWGFAIVGYGD